MGVEHEEELAHYVSLVWDDCSESKGDLYTLYPDTLPCLEELRSIGRKLGIVSNCPSKAYLQKHLRQLGILGYFSSLVSSGSEGFSKPHPRIFEIASSRMGLRETSLLHVGDKPQTDVLGARKAGIKAILLDREGKHPEPEYTKISNLTQLQRLL
jgi:HAD superfamily hydrolase (TIGR01509 family)